jgi:1,5-anhydro-D-fructose reductase (1,5-anhydro-D-mannitol-forming)
VKKSGWGFIGASNIAREYKIAAVRAQSDQDVVALARSNIGRAREFAQAHNIGAAYDRRR